MYIEVSDHLYFFISLTAHQNSTKAHLTTTPTRAIPQPDLSAPTPT